MAIKDNLLKEKDKGIFYPESDGKLMADNTKQFNWIVKLVGGLRSLFQDRDDVLVVGDLLWYPIEGEPKTCVAPDVMTVFGRPKGDRGSYKQWEEDDIAPQVVFEVLSPSNKSSEMMQKQLFYHRYGVKEYCVIDPDESAFFVWLRNNGGLSLWDEKGSDWQSELLGIKMTYLEDGEIEVFFPDGSPFLLPEEYKQLAIEEKQRADQQEQRAIQQEQRAKHLDKALEEERKANEAKQAEIEALRAKLAQLGGE